jgi:AcrR family transcriptional regulator
VLDGALAEIDVHGPAALSLRQIARRAGVSHAAPAHHFGDKAGVLTAIASEGYSLLADATRAGLETGDFAQGGIAYIRFAITHRSHFEVMFRPDLYRFDDPAVVAARGAAAEVLFEGVRGLLGPGREDEVWGGVVAIWSFTHGFSTLWLAGNFTDVRSDDVDAAVRLAGDAITRLASTGALRRS